MGALAEHSGFVEILMQAAQAVRRVLSRSTRDWGYVRSMLVVHHSPLPIAAEAGRSSEATRT
jgi:hypothetical protein